MCIHPKKGQENKINHCLSCIICILPYILSWPGHGAHEPRGPTDTAKAFLLSSNKPAGAHNIDFSENKQLSNFPPQSKQQVSLVPAAIKF